MDLEVGAGLVAMACFVLAALTVATRPKPDPSKPKFVLTSAGCLGCLFTLSVIIGLLSSVVSLAAAVKKFLN
jgi:hypothetical protein